MDEADLGKARLVDRGGDDGGGLTSTVSRAASVSGRQSGASVIGSPAA
jgi:hypothetical protein